MKKLILVSLCLLLSFAVMAQIKVEKPTSKLSTTFAIVVDSDTYINVNKEIAEYRAALEADGLSTYVLSGKWSDPMQVRDQIKKIYAKSPNLEGIVLIGDVPVALVRNGQHMTTAFKMDEDNLKEFPMNESSVASDRFYDDLHLEFELIKQDSINPLHFYYNLAANSPQKLNPNFYSGRIMYPSELGGDKYKAIASFLNKAVREKKAADQLDNLVTFAGDAYNSDCLVAWMDEKLAINENFPLTIKSRQSTKHLNFRMDDYMKHALFDELQRPEVDIMLFNEHGSPHKQHINGNPIALSNDARLQAFKSGIYYYLAKESRKKNGDIQGAKDHFAKEYGLTEEFFKDFDYAQYMREDSISRANIAINLPDLKGFNTQPRFVMFNACYNGSFHKAGNIAGYYIFNDGRTVATQGNTVNVLQDRWTYEMIGLLSHGVRVGQWNRHIATLEGHIVGDPTFRFRPIEANTLGQDIVVKRNDVKYWRGLLDSPYADVRSIALRTLADNGAITSAELLQTMKDCQFATTRLECLKLLSRYRNADYIEGIKLGLYDSYEQTRRNAATYAWQVGDNSVLLPAVDLVINYPESQRVAYSLTKVMTLYPVANVLSAVNTVIDNNNYVDKEAKRAKVTKQINGIQARKDQDLKVLTDTSKSYAERISAIRSTRNNTYHMNVPAYLELIKNNKEDVRLRIAMTEALGWFVSTPMREQIISTFKTMASDKNLDQALKDELTQTIIRLQ